MSKAALCPTSTVSSANRRNRGSTVSIVGCPASMSRVIPCTATDASGRLRCGSTRDSKVSPASRRPLRIRTAPSAMISSPSAGLSPVVSVSNTVYASASSRRSSNASLAGDRRKRSKS